MHTGTEDGIEAHFPMTLMDTLGTLVDSNNRVVAQRNGFPAYFGSYLEYAPYTEQVGQEWMKIRY